MSTAQHWISYLTRSIDTPGVRVSSCPVTCKGHNYATRPVWASTFHRPPCAPRCPPAFTPLCPAGTGGPAANEPIGGRASDASLHLLCAIQISAGPSLSGMKLVECSWRICPWPDPDVSPCPPALWILRQFYSSPNRSRCPMRPQHPSDIAHDALSYAMDPPTSMMSIASSSLFAWLSKDLHLTDPSRSCLHRDDLYF